MAKSANLTKSKNDELNVPLSNVETKYGHIVPQEPVDCVIYRQQANDRGYIDIYVHNRAPFCALPIDDAWAAVTDDGYGTCRQTVIRALCIVCGFDAVISAIQTAKCKTNKKSACLRDLRDAEAIYRQGIFKILRRAKKSGRGVRVEFLLLDHGHYTNGEPFFMGILEFPDMTSFKTYSDLVKYDVETENTQLRKILDEGWISIRAIPGMTNDLRFALNKFVDEVKETKLVKACVRPGWVPSDTAYSLRLRKLEPDIFLDRRINQAEIDETVLRSGLSADELAEIGCLRRDILIMRTFGYISDLHLDWTLYEAGAKSWSQAREIIGKVVNKLCENGVDRLDAIVFAGDISPDPSIFHLFVDALSHMCIGQTVIFVPGNHEYNLFMKFTNMSLTGEGSLISFTDDHNELDEQIADKLKELDIYFD